MSEFSEKCKKYIQRSDTNVYQIAKKSGLDRTTLQKMVQGKRLPGKQFLETMCQYLIMNNTEKEELMRLYYIEKIGKEEYECRQEVHSFLTDFLELRRDLEEINYTKHIQFESGSKSVRGGNINCILLDTDVRDAVQYVIARAFAECEKVNIYMDMFEDVFWIMKQVIQAERSKKKEVYFRQFVKFGRTDHVCALENIKMMRMIIPFAFALRNFYEVYYCYGKSASLDMTFSLFPHYLITEKNVLLLAEDGRSGILLEQEELSRAYIRELERLKKYYQKLFTYAGEEGLVASHFMGSLRPEQFVFSYETTPCVSEMIVPIMKMGVLENNSMVSDYMGMHTWMEPYLNCKMIYGLGGVEAFIRTGCLPELYGKYVPPVPMEIRQIMLKGYVDTMSERNNGYLLKGAGGVMQSGLNVELFEPNKIVIFSVEKDFPLGIIIIEEPGLFRVFLDYFEYLIEEEKVYSPEESVVKFGDICKEILNSVMM